MWSRRPVGKCSADDPSAWQDGWRRRDGPAQLPAGYSDATRSHPRETEESADDNGGGPVARERHRAILPPPPIPPHRRVVGSTSPASRFCAGAIEFQSTGARRPLCPSCLCGFPDTGRSRSGTAVRARQGDRSMLPGSTVPAVVAAHFFKPQSHDGHRGFPMFPLAKLDLPA